MNEYRSPGLRGFLGILIKSTPMRSVTFPFIQIFLPDGSKSKRVVGADIRLWNDGRGSSFEIPFTIDMF